MEGRADDRLGCWKVEAKKLLKASALSRGEDNFIPLCTTVAGIEPLLVLALEKDQILFLLSPEALEVSFCA